MERASFLAVAPAGKAKQIKEAQEMTRVVSERARKLNLPVPPYNLLELTGKGAFGRVFKSTKDGTKTLVAVKIVDVDTSDYKLAPGDKDQAIKDFVSEISILRTLKDSKAKNINLIHEAFSFHSQLWIVSEYCPGGSVHTLMRACNDNKLEEKFIIPISRELAIALKYVHEAGIIHRDVKSANILITQDGQLQLCDFGVSGVLESNLAKRSTIIGTPYWMAPELHAGGNLNSGYGTEIDCWAFGCTVYEMATGQPPNAKIAPKRLHLFLQQAPRLEDGEFSESLREFVASCLEENPEQRPSAEGILKQPYIANTSKNYPTASLRQLIERYAAWEGSGGQRASLFQPMGAAAPTSFDPFGNGNEEWNFSTTDDFADEVLSHFEAAQEPLSHLTPFERAQQEQRVQRGARKMARLFDENAEPYEYSQDDDDETSDLPFRRSTAFSNKRETIIDLDDARASQDLSSGIDLNLADAETIRAKKGNLRFFYDEDDEDNYQYHSHDTRRFNNEWTFGAVQTQPATSVAKRDTRDWSMAEAMREISLGETDTNAETARILQRPQLMHTTTEPIGSIGDFMHPSRDVSELAAEPPERDSMIDLDAGFELARQPSNTSILSSDGDFPSNSFDDITIRARPGEAEPLFNHAPSLSQLSVPSESHTRDSSLSSDNEGTWSAVDSQLDEPFQEPNISVKESIDSLRHAAEDDEEEWELGATNKQAPTLSLPNGQLGRGKWSQYDRWDGVVSPNRMERSTNRSHLLRQIEGAPLTSPGFRRISPKSTRPIVSRRLGSDDTDSRLYGQNVRNPRIVTYPEAHPPDPIVLDDDADTELVMGELDRLLDGFMQGLDAAKYLLEDEQRRRQKPVTGVNGLPAPHHPTRHPLRQTHQLAQMNGAPSPRINGANGPSSTSASFG